MSDAVTFSRQGPIGLITVNNPPVNALSHAVRAGLKDAVAQGLADSEVNAMVIWCEGRPVKMYLTSLILRQQIPNPARERAVLDTA